MSQSFGTLAFEEIPTLPAQWWEDQPRDYPDSVWKTWDRNTYYLWGANHTNALLFGCGYTIGGGGMAGARRGPTRGRAHPHYIGINTMELTDTIANKAIFTGLQKLITGGYNVVVPTFNDSKLAKGEFKFKYSLGTGIGANVSDWLKIQLNIFEEISTLASIGGPVVMPKGTYWPDLSGGSSDPLRLPLESVAELDAVIEHLQSEQKKHQ